MANIYGMDPVAWSIDGGRHNGELMRVLGYVAGGGAEGIVSPGDCKVKQLTTAGSQITIDPGALLIRNRIPQVVNQTYVANGRSRTTLDVAPTGSSGRHDLVVVRVEDPQYGGTWPQVPEAERPTYQYVKPVILQNVAAGTKRASDLNLGYAAVGVARLEIPPNTAAITSGMIKDIRKVAQPFSSFEYDVQSGIPASDGSAVALTSTNWVNWPANSFTFEVPVRATHVVAAMEIVNVPHNGSVDYETRVVWTSGGFSRVSYTGHMDYNGTAGNGERLTIKNFWKFYADEFVGKTVTMNLQARRINTAVADGWVGIGSWEQVSFDIRFFEEAV